MAEARQATLMAKFALYSDQIIPQNREVDRKLLRLLPLGSTIGFVPSAGDPNGVWAASRRDYYGAIGLNLVCSHDPAVDTEPSLQRLLSCDAIHLSGGNTRVFRQRLDASGMMSALGEFSARGGVLIGASAGAILLTPNIAVDALFQSQLPSSDAPTGLGLVDFDFFPHVRAKLDYVPALATYSRSIGRPILGCPDGAGVIVHDGHLELVGVGLVISNGETRDWNVGGLPDALTTSGRDRARQDQ